MVLTDFILAAIFFKKFLLDTNKHDPCKGNLKKFIQIFPSAHLPHIKGAIWLVEIRLQL